MAIDQIPLRMLCTPVSTIFSLLIVFLLQGYSPTIVYPKRPQRLPFTNLTKSCQVLNIPVVDVAEIPSAEDIDKSYDLVLDSIFGFSFKGSVRAPFDQLLDSLKACHAPVCSVDVPSGRIFGVCGKGS